MLCNLPFQCFLVRIGDLGERCQPKEDDEKSHKTGHSQIGPLNVSQASVGINRVSKEHSRSQQWCNKGSNALYCLSQVEPDLAVFRGSTDREEPVREYVNKVPSVYTRVVPRTYGSAAVSRVERPAPTTNMLPQNPPNDLFRPLGQKRRHPTASTARPDQESQCQPSFRHIAPDRPLPVMKVTRNPYRRTIHPEMVSGQMK